MEIDAVEYPSDYYNYCRFIGYSKASPVESLSSNGSTVDSQVISVILPSDF